MKKNLILLALLALAIPAGALFYGCGSSSNMAAPSTVPTPPCSSPSIQGFSSVGSSTLSVPAASIGVAPVTLASQETATNISLYISGTATGQVRFAIYYEASPSLLAIQTDPQNLVSNSWNTASLGNLFMPASVYILCFQFTNPNTIAFQTSGAIGFEYEYPIPWSVFPSSFPSATSTLGYDDTLSMYLSTCP